MRKISQKQLLKDFNGKMVNLLGVPFHTWSALVVDEEEKLREWLYKAERIDVSNACKGDYQPCYTTSNRIHRGGSVLDVKGYTVYKTSDNKYILVQVYEDKRFDEFSIKLIIYHCRESL